jgi:F-type H+-transporting ATPase subunit b
MEIVSNIALITINGTLFHQLIAFLIFLFIINRLMFRPLRGVMEERERFIEEIKLDTADKASELEGLTVEMRKREAAVREKALEIKQQLEEGGNQEAAKIFESTQQEIGSIKEKIEMEVNAQISDAKTHLKKESETLAIGIMEKLLDRRLVP